MSTGNRRGRLPSPPGQYNAQWANQLVNQLELNLSNTNLAASIDNYIMTNVTADRVLDADSTTLAEVADVLGTLVNDLKNRGVIG
tara:strand:- start:31 stop:285 length:255 start_codon:yes stop_codon:yes gene_type:complete